MDADQIPWSPPSVAGNDHVDEDLLAEMVMVLRDSSPDALCMVRELFQTDVPGRLDDIGAALADGRFDAAARASHSLRGSAGAFGARALSELGMQLEQDCRASDRSSACAVLAEMRAELVLFSTILGARLGPPA